MKNGLVVAQMLKVKTLKQVDSDRGAFDAAETDAGSALCVQRKDVGKLRRMVLAGKRESRRLVNAWEKRAV